MKQPFVASLTSQLILQPFSRFTYVTGTSPKSPGEPPMTYNDKLVVTLGLFKLRGAWLDDLGSISRCGGGVEIVLHSFLSRQALDCT